MVMSRGMKLALGQWASFGGSHLAMSHEPVREKLIEMCGSEKTYRYLYSGVALCTLLPFAAAFTLTPASQRGAVVLDKYKKGSLWKHMSAVFRAAGCIFVTDSFMSAVKNPLALNAQFETPEPTDSREIQRKYQVFGLQRVTRHNEAFGFSLYCMGMMMRARRTPADLTMWGLGVVFAIVAAWHQEQRVKKYKPQRFFDETSFIPFQAVFEGKQKLRKVSVEVGPTAYAAGFCCLGHTYFWRWA